MKKIEFEQTPFKTVINISNIPHVDLSISQYGYEIPPKDKGAVTNSQLPTFRFHYIVNGRVTFKYGDKEVCLKKNNCFLIQPNQTSLLTFDKTSDVRHYWVSLSGKSVKPYFQQAGITEYRPYVFIPANLQDKLKNAFFNNFNISIEKQELTDLVFLENFMKILQIVNLTHKGQLIKPSKKQKNYIEQALEYINSHYMFPDFTIKDVANALYLHKNYFSVLFKKDIGIPFNTYLSQKRVEQALSLIKQNYDSVNEIATAVGFVDASYFTKIFKKYNTISPSEEIKKVQKEHDTISYI